MADEQNDQQQPTGVTVNDTGAGTATATIDREALEAERSAEQEEELLAGKFKTPEDLAKAYKELEAKLGKPNADAADNQEDDDDETVDDNGDAGEDDEDDNVSAYGEVVANALKEAEVDASAAADEFAKDGTLSEDTFAKFEKAGFPRGVVEAYLRGVSNDEPDQSELAQTQIDSIKTSVGGDEAFGKLREFIGSQYTDAEKVAFNEAVSSGNFETALKAVNDAKVRYNDEFGREGKLAGGKTPAADSGYGDWSEVKADMAKPEYKKSQAFREQVEAKLARSSFIITR